MAKQIIYQGKIDNLLLDVSDLEIEIVRGDVDHVVLQNCETSLVDITTHQTTTPIPASATKSETEPASHAAPATGQGVDGTEFVSLRDQLQLGQQQTTVVVKQIMSFWHGKRRRPIWTSLFMRPMLRIVLGTQTHLHQLDLNQTQGAATITGIKLGKVNITLDNAKLDFVNCEVEDLRLKAYLTHFNWNGSRVRNSFSAQLQDARCTALGSLQPMVAQVQTAHETAASANQVEFGNLDVSLHEQGVQQLLVDAQLQLQLVQEGAAPVTADAELAQMPKFSWTCANSMLMWN